MTDELTGAEPKAVSTSFSDPYMLVVRDDASVLLLECDDNGDLEELDRGDPLLETSWLSGSLFRDRDQVFAGTGPEEKSALVKETVIMFLLSAAGALHVIPIPSFISPSSLTTSCRSTNYPTS